MEELFNLEMTVSQSKRKTTNNIKSKNMFLPSSNNKRNIIDLDNNNFDDLLKDFEDLNGTFFTDRIFKVKTKNRNSFISKIPSPGKNCSINLGKKYKNFESKL